MSAILASVSAILALALLTWRAAAIKIRDNIDEFINDLARQGRWYNRGALVIFIAAALNLIALSWPMIQ